MFHPSRVTLTASFLATKEESMKDAIGFLKQITGMVSTFDANGNKLNEGSCFFFSNQFFLLTAAHVVEGAATIYVKFEQTERIPALLVRSHAFFDLALLQLEGYENKTHELPYLKLAPWVDQGSIVYCGGFYNGNFQCTEGNITHGENAQSLVATNLTDHGTSGGPAVSREFRKLIGVIREDYGISHHRTCLIPYWSVDHFLRMDPHGPQIELFRLT